MPITRTVHADGSWTEKADDPKSARELAEKHGPALQKLGREDFQKKWLRDNKVGFEKVRDPSGAVTHIRADEVGTSMASGYTPVANPTMIMPNVPWEKKSSGPGKHRFKYNPQTGAMEEI